MSRLPGYLRSRLSSSAGRSGRNEFLQELGWRNGAHGRILEIAVVAGHDHVGGNRFSAHGLEMVFEVASGKTETGFGDPGGSGCDVGPVEQIVQERPGRFVPQSFRWRAAQKIVAIRDGVPRDPRPRFVGGTPVQERLAIIDKSLAFERNIDQDVGVDENPHLLVTEDTLSPWVVREVAVFHVFELAPPARAKANSRCLLF